MPECGCQPWSIDIGVSRRSNSKWSRNTNGFMISPRSDGLASRVMGPPTSPRVRWMICRTGVWICCAIMVSSSRLVLCSLRSRRLRGGRLHGLHLELDVDAIADEDAARFEHLVPPETEVLPVEARLREERDALVTP